jgi:hypothetical protein
MHHEQLTRPAVENRLFEPARCGWAMVFVATGTRRAARASDAAESVRRPARPDAADVAFFNGCCQWSICGRAVRDLIFSGQSSATSGGLPQSFATSGGLPQLPVTSGRWPRSSTGQGRIDYPLDAREKRVGKGNLI